MAASLVHAAAASSPMQGSAAAPARAGGFHPLASSPFLRLACGAASSTSSRRRCLLDAPLRALPAGAPRLAAGWGAPRTRRVVATFAGEESVDSELVDDKGKGKDELKPEEAQEVWKEMLKQFKDEAQRMHGLTLKAYDVYSQRAKEVLLEASEKLKIQADKAQKDLSVIATEVGEEGQEYLKLAAQNSPDSIKDINETFNSLGKLKISEYEDYHVGIPFGTFLTVGGFLNFMLTGKVSAIRFGIVLGFALLALGISSLRSQRAGGRRPRLLLKGQAVRVVSKYFRGPSQWSSVSLLHSTYCDGWPQRSKLREYSRELMLPFKKSHTGDESAHGSSAPAKSNPASISISISDEKDGDHPCDVSLSQLLCSAAASNVVNPMFRSAAAGLSCDCCTRRVAAQPCALKAQR
uniref:Uncharacterized protein n=1 Tax=Leersia perrieri TaxID=77586 RepID=A0A0D9V781_9ORYZ